MNGLDLNKFINDHAYKDSHRVALTAYLDTCEYESFSRMLERAIDLNIFGNHDIYIIDDVRCYDAQIKYLQTHCTHKWNMYSIRINATDKSRMERGWIRTDYDDHMCENDLDDYVGFNAIINNDGTVDELRETILSLNIGIAT